MVCARGFAEERQLALRQNVGDILHVFDQNSAFLDEPIATATSGIEGRAGHSENFSPLFPCKPGGDE